MSTFYRLSADMVLVRNNKGDAYYMTTPKSCSCPAATYHPSQPCKHARKYSLNQRGRYPHRRWTPSGWRGSGMAITGLGSRMDVGRR